MWFFRPKQKAMPVDGIQRLQKTNCNVILFWSIPNIWTIFVFTCKQFSFWDVQPQYVPICIETASSLHVGISGMITIDSTNSPKNIYASSSSLAIKLTDTFGYDIQHSECKIEHIFLFFNLQA